MKNVIGNIRNIIRSIYKRIKSSYGKMNGLSSCSHCGLAWNVVKQELLSKGFSEKDLYDYENALRGLFIRENSENG